MPGSTAGRSSVTPSTTDYDDAAPLTQEEEEALSKMEADSRSSDLKTSDSPPQKKRKRGLSASPHLTPSRLRSSVKATARALDAGYKPNTNHAFRQDLSSNKELSSNMPPPISAIANGAAMIADANARRSQLIDPSEQNLQLGGHDNRSAMADNDGRRSLSIGPIAHNRPAAQMAERGNPGGMVMIEHPGAHYHQYPQIPHPQRADNDARRSLSIGPITHNQPAAETGERGNPGGMAEHPDAHYHPYPQIPHPQQAHRLGYVAYSGPGQPHPHSMPAPYFQPPGLSFGNLQNPVFYPNPPIQDHNQSRIQPGMPTEGPNPAANVFSPQYIPADREPYLQASVPRPAAHSTSSLPTRHSTPAPARSLTPSDNTSRLALGPSTVAEATASAAEPTKCISIQAVTPLPAILEDSNVDCEGDHEYDADVLGGPSKLEDSPTVGRMSNAARLALRKGFKELDAVLKQISTETGLHPAQIVDRWDATNTRVVNSWNIYQSFFEERRDEELDRLPMEARPPAGSLPNRPTISACYERFKASRPDTYDNVLRAWHRLHQMKDKGEMSVSKRAREFRRHTDKIDNLIRQASSIYGFEALCITVGGVVNQDQDLAQLIGSDATIDFFLERYRSSDSLALGQMKAHVYDRLSKRMLLDDDLPRDDTYTAVVTVKKESTPSGETAVPTIQDLKEKFIELASRHRITVTKRANLLWRALPQNIAEKGCVLVNWPEDVPFPCDEAGKNTSKGISVLKQPARTLLFAAFDHPIHPLSIEKKYKSGVPVDKPVIIGVPPDSSSPHAYGRRKFLDNNLNEDRQGPARLKSTAASKAKKPTSRTSKKEPSMSSKKVEVEDDSDVSVRLLVDASDGEEDAEPNAPKKKPASKPKPEVHFVLPDDADDPIYSSSQDGSAQYSGSEDDMPLVRSPHNLRPKASSKHKKSQTKRALQKRRSQKRPLSSAEEEEAAASEAASIIELDAEPTPRPSESDKKKCIQPNAEHGLTDKVAEALFGDFHHTEEAVKSMASAPAVHTGPKPPPPTAALHSNQPPHTDIAQPPIPHANHTSALPTPASHTNQAAQVECGQPPVPQQQPMDRLPNPQLPALRQGQEAFYPTNYHAFSEAYSGRYAPPDHRLPANWSLAPGQGWYPSGPGNPPPPAASNPPLSGPAHHGGYWAHHGPPMYGHPYGHYPPPNVQAAHPPPDDISRTRGDGQAGPSM